ncbi:MAG TPA: response regulator [Gammaproteobacteria bacterium]|nr:response regulator [Gammaproteobacteria bacterium]
MIHTLADILVVEDDAPHRDIMTRRMQGTSYQVRFAVNGQDALDQVVAKKPDLLLLDVMLPEVMGLQVLHTLRQSHSMVDLPIIMVTAIDENDRIVRALELGANDYVTKPINYPILMARIQTQLSLKQLAAMNTEFLATASHDLRKPLAQIADTANQARLQLASSEVNRQHLLDDFTRISQWVAQIHNITACVLDMQTSGFAQIRLTKTPVQMEQLVEESIAYQRETVRNKQLRLLGPKDNPRLVVEADRNRIRQVLDHLIDNAILSSAPGGCINVNLFQAGDCVRVEVIDDGAGLRQEFLQTLFQDEELDADRGSDSIGLCKQLIELHQGELGVVNNKGNTGTTYWFSLPLFKLRTVE